MLPVVWMSIVARELCDAWTRRESLSHVRRTTSPASLLTLSREPFATVTVRSDCGVRVGRSCAEATAAAHVNSAAPATRVACLIT